MTDQSATQSASIATGMLRWWSSELAAMLPTVVRRAVGLDPDILLLRLSDTQLDVDLRGSGKDRHLASMPWPGKDEAATAALRDLLAKNDSKDVRVVISLDPGLTLSRKFQIPRAAETEIIGVLAFEIERQTPFRENEIYFEHTVDSESSTDSTLSVDLVIVPRRIVDPLIGALSSLGFGLDRVAVNSAQKVEATMVPVEGGGQRVRHGNNALMLWLALTVVLAATAVTTPLIRLSSMADDLAVAVLQAKADAETTLALQAETDRLTLGMNVIARAHADASSPLAILHALSALLPDGTWVVQFNVVGDEVIIEGRTDSSSRLVGLLEASPLIESVKYLAPITLDAGEGVERFNFSLQLARG